MLSKEVYESCRERAKGYFEKAGIVITDAEMEAFQVAEYGLDCVDTIGLELIEYVNTDRCCAKELVLFPYQTCPEHRHPPVLGEPGKEETFRCRYGEVYLYVPGEPAAQIMGRVPEGLEDCFLSRHEIILRPGEQYTLSPDTWHWFQAGPNGAVVSEFSTKSRDEFDIYTDPRINPAEKRNV